MRGFSCFRRIILFLIFTLILPFSSGCWNMVESNNAAVVTAMGYDLASPGHIKFSAQIITPQSGGGGEGGGGPEQPFLTFSATDRTTAKAARDLSISVPRTLLWAHASTYVVGEKMAREGMEMINDFLDRNRFVRRSGVLVVAKGTDAEEVLKAELPTSQNPMFDIVTMLKLQDQQIGVYTLVQLRHYLNSLITPGIDPILPAVEIIKQEDKQMLRLSGMAVFREDRLVGYLNEAESRGYRWLRRNPSVQGGLLTIKSPQTDKPVLIEILRSNSSIKPQIEKNQIVYKIEIQAEGSFYEQSDNVQIVTPELLQAMENRAATSIKNEALNFLTRSQELNSDCLGLGLTLYRQNPKVWDQIGSQWYQYYPQIKFDFDVRANIRRTGLSNKTLQIKP